MANKTNGENPHAENGEREKTDFASMSAAAQAFYDQERVEAFSASFTFVPTFSRQFKKGIAKYHRADEPVYELMDESEFGAIARAGCMWLLSAVLFFVVSFFFVALWSGRLPPCRMGFGETWDAPLLFCGIAAAAALLQRFAIRPLAEWIIVHHAKELYIQFSSRLAYIHDLTVNAIQNSRVDAIMTPQWPERSSGWIKVAYWLGRRYDDMVRYTTATCWRVSFYFRTVRNSALAVIVLLAIAAAGIVLQQRPHPCASLLLTAAVYAAALAVFCPPLYGKDLWANKLFEDVSAFDAQKKRVYDMIAGIVFADKKYYIAGQRLGSGGSQRDGQMVEPE
jgi:hypothetical protein